LHRWTRSNAYGLALDRAGSLFFTDPYNNALRKVDLTTFAVTTVLGTFGQIGVILGTGRAGLSYPLGVAVGSAGELFVSDEGAILYLK